jgi:hypothetical protein
LFTDFDRTFFRVGYYASIVLVNRYERAMSRLEKLKPRMLTRLIASGSCVGFFDALTASPLDLDTWDEQLWRLLVVKGVVGRDGGIEFEFRNGRKILA